MPNELSNIPPTPDGATLRFGAYRVYYSQMNGLWVLSSQNGTRFGPISNAALSALYAVLRARNGDHVFVACDAPENCAPTVTTYDADILAVVREENARLKDRLQAYETEKARLTSDIATRDMAIDAFRHQVELVEKRLQEVMKDRDFTLTTLTEARERMALTEQALSAAPFHTRIAVLDTSLTPRDRNVVLDTALAQCRRDRTMLEDKLATTTQRVSQLEHSKATVARHLTEFYGAVDTARNRLNDRVDAHLLTDETDANA